MYVRIRARFETMPCYYSLLVEKEHTGALGTKVWVKRDTRQPVEWRSKCRATYTRTPATYVHVSYK